MTTAITYGYVDGDYVDSGYIVELEGVSIQFVHATAGTISFETGFKYPAYQMNIVQPKETTVCNVTVYFNPVLANMPFEATFTNMTDLELTALRTFMFTDLPLFDEFTLKAVGQDMSFPVRFASRKLKVKHLLPGRNEVTVQLVRV